MNFFKYFNFFNKSCDKETSNNIESCKHKTEQTDIHKLVEEIKENKHTEKENFENSHKKANLKLIIAFLKPYCAVMRTYYQNSRSKENTQNTNNSFDVNEFLSCLINVTKTSNNKLINLEEFKNSYDKFQNSIEQFKNEVPLFKKLKCLINNLNGLIVDSNIKNDDCFEEIGKKINLFFENTKDLLESEYGKNISAEMKNNYLENIKIETYEFLNVLSLKIEFKLLEEMLTDFTTNFHSIFLKISEDFDVELKNENKDFDKMANYYVDKKIEMAKTIQTLDSIKSIKNFMDSDKLLGNIQELEAKVDDILKKLREFFDTTKLENEEKLFMCIIDVMLKKIENEVENIKELQNEIETKFIFAKVFIDMKENIKQQFLYIKNLLADFRTETKNYDYLQKKVNEMLKEIENYEKLVESLSGKILNEERKRKNYKYFKELSEETLNIFEEIDDTLAKITLKFNENNKLKEQFESKISEFSEKFNNYKKHFDHNIELFNKIKEPYDQLFLEKIGKKIFSTHSVSLKRKVDISNIYEEMLKNNTKSPEDKPGINKNSITNSNDLEKNKWKKLGLYGGLSFIFILILGTMIYLIKNK